MKPHKAKKKRTPIVTPSKLTLTQHRVKDVLAADGWVQWEQDVKVKPPNTISVVEAFGLFDKDGRMIQRLSRKTVEDCARDGVLGCKKLKGPDALRFLVRIGPHADAPLRQEHVS